MISQKKWQQYIKYNQIVAGKMKTDIPKRCFDEYAFSGKLLDCAAGWTDMKEYFEERGCEYYGIDLIAYPDRSIVTGDVHDMPFSDEFFDWVVSSHTLEHVPAPMIMLWEINRVLKMGGMFLLAVPYPDFGDCPEHIIVPTIEQTRRLLNRAGFKPIQHKECEFTIYWLCEKVKRFDWGD